MEILAGVRPRHWWEDFWKDPQNNYGDPSKTLLEYSHRFYEDLKVRVENPRAIDVGSGDGRYALSLAEMGFDTDALEFAESGVKQIKEIASKKGLSIRAIQEDFTSEQFRPERYDLVLSSGLIEEVVLEYHEFIVKRMQEMVKVNGYILLKYCLEITGRGQLVQDGLIPQLFDPQHWEMVRCNEESEMHESRARFTTKGEIDSAIRTGTIIAKKLFI